MQQCWLLTLLPSCFVTQGMAFVSFSTQTSQENIFVKLIFFLWVSGIQGCCGGYLAAGNPGKINFSSWKPGRLQEWLGWCVDASIFLYIVPNNPINLDDGGGMSPLNYTLNFVEGETSACTFNLLCPLSWALNFIRLSSELYQTSPSTSLTLCTR